MRPLVLVSSVFVFARVTRQVPSVLFPLLAAELSEGTGPDRRERRWARGPRMLPQLNTAAALSSAFGPSRPAPPGKGESGC